MSRSHPNQPGTVGARGPLKPEKFFVHSRPQAPPISLGDDSDNWWGGVFQCASFIALGTVVAISSLSTTQASAVANSWQDEFGSGGIHEDHWQNPTQPTTLSLGALYAPDPEELPAGSLSNELIDEDYWQTPLILPLPTSTTPQSPWPSIVDPDFAPFFPDEDYWQNLPPFIVTLSFYQPSTIFIDPDQVFPLATFTPDEDYWQSRVNPVSSILGPLYIPDPEESPAGLLVNLTVDELYWQNPVPPVIASLWQPLPLVVDPDFTPSFMEEYYWQNPTAPISATTYQRLPLGDPEELSAGSLHGQPDEDIWVNSVAPVQFVNICPQQFLFDIQEPAGSLSEHLTNITGRTQQSCPWDGHPYYHSPHPTTK